MTNRAYAEVTEDNFLYYHRLKMHRCATRGISCLTWMVCHTRAYFWQVHMRDFIGNREMSNKRRL